MCEIANPRKLAKLLHIACRVYVYTENVRACVFAMPIMTKITNTLVSVCQVSSRATE